MATLSRTPGAWTGIVLKSPSLLLPIRQRNWKVALPSFTALNLKRTSWLPPWGTVTVALLPPCSSSPSTWRVTAASPVWPE